MSDDARRGPAARHLEAAAANADLGLPIPPGTRFRLVKRVLARVMWLFGRPQVTYNHAMLDAARELSNSVGHIATAVPEHVGNEVGSMRSQVGSVAVDLAELRARLEELECRLAAFEAGRTESPRPSR
jgi:hypothetical protein